MNILEVLTVGLPFCVFKIISGQSFNQGWLIYLGAIDALINLTNLLSLIFTRKRFFDACLLSFFVRTLKRPSLESKWRWQDLGNSLDIILSFSLVAIMIGWSRIPLLSPIYLWTWNISVILNVFGAGLSRLSGSLRNLDSSHAPRDV